ncbi:MAG: MATE family efflux transporter [Bauldia sp.]|nr:MATE family efflux transporter [Bauldia sp.]
MHNVASSGTVPRGAWNAEFRATLLLAWPLILTNLSQIALATTDVIMMGWLGPQFLAAGALGANLNFAFLIFGIGLITATSPLIAIELGRRRHSVREVRRTVRQGFWAAIAFAVPVWIVLWQAEPILLALHHEPNLAKNAASYLHTFQWSFLPFLLYLVLRNFISALERPVAALWISGAAVFVNAFLVWVLMFGKLGFPALGLPGAGIGTTLTNIFMAAGLLGLIYADRRFRRYHLIGRFWRPDWPRFREIWRIGLPIAFTLGFEVTIFNAAVFLMGLISAEALAAHSIAIQIASVAFMVPLGFGMAATVRVGLAYGAGDITGVARAGWAAYIMALGYACCAAAGMLLFGRQLVGAFLDLGTPANFVVIDLAVSFLVFAGIFQLADAGQAASSGMLRGLGDTRVPMLYAALGYWGVGLPLAIVLGFWTELAGRGIWVGLAAGLGVVATLLTLRWVSRERLGLTRQAWRPAGSAALAAGVPGISPSPLA